MVPSGGVEHEVRLARKEEPVVVWGTRLQQAGDGEEVVIDGMGTCNGIEREHTRRPDRVFFDIALL
jgi:hypothetical protein